MRLSAKQEAFIKYALDNNKGVEWLLGVLGLYLIKARLKGSQVNPEGQNNDIPFNMGKFRD